MTDALVVSDIHLGWEESNVSEFMKFLNFVEKEQPERLVIAGDLFEFWRRGSESVTLEFNDVIDRIEEMNMMGTPVIPLAGNHDWILTGVNDEEPIIQEAPWNFRTSYTFNSGDKTFRVVHGNETDAVNASRRQNTLLCRTSDSTGNKIANGYSNITGRLPLGGASITGPLYFNRFNIRSFSHVANPAQLAEEDESGRRERITRRLTAKYDEYVLFGHTHTPEMGETRHGRYANSGSFTGDMNTYIEVVDGEVDVKEFEPGLAEESDETAKEATDTTTLI